MTMNVFAIKLLNAYNMNKTMRFKN